MSEFVICAHCGARVKAGRPRCPRCEEILVAVDLRPLHERMGMSPRSLQALGIAFALVTVVGGAILWQLRPRLPDEVARPAPGAVQPRPQVQAQARETATAAVMTTSTFEPVTPLDSTRLANASINDGDFDAARASFEKALEKNASDPEALNGLGQALVRLGRISEAIPKFERAVVLQPEKWAYRFNLAHALAGLAQWDAAIVQYREAQRIFPDDYATQYNLAMALHKKGDEQAAIPEFEKAISLAPSEPTFHVSLGISLEKAGRVREAIREYQAYLEMDPDAPDAPKVKAHVAALTAS